MRRIFKVMKKSILSKSQKRDERTAYLFVLPFILMFALFKLYPMIYGIMVSFWQRNSLRSRLSTAFAGLANYKTVLSTSTFWTSLGHSLVFSFIYVVLLMLIGFVIAMFFNKKFYGRTAVRTMFYLPYVTNMIAVGIVFKYMLNPTQGPVNAIFRLFGFAGPQWFSSPRLALVTATVIAVWAALAFNVITILAALQDVPADLFEVAEIEGASRIQKIRYVVIPIIAPALFMLLTITIINSFKNYTTIVALTNGGPGTSSRVLSLQIYDDAFTYSKYAVASAEGVLFAILIIFINAIVSKVRDKCLKSL